LELRVKDGAFREDLFHRLNVIRLRLPALRERVEDIPVLTRHFLQQSAQQLGVEPKRISDAAQACLTAFQFPGNVRQLENICHWLTVMAPAQVIEPKDLPPEVVHSPNQDGASAPSRGITHANPIPAEALRTNVVEGMALDPHPPGSLNGHGDMVYCAPAASPPLAAATPTRAGVLNMPGADWELGLEAEAMDLLLSGRTDVWEALTRRFESKLIMAALANTRGRRIEAAVKLGIGRNTITRKIQELGLDD
jgi:two-component system nitrogen regulation response regulator GlnG